MNIEERQLFGRKVRPNNWFVVNEGIPLDANANHRAVSAAGAAVSITFAAVSKARHVIEGVHVGYDATPQAGAYLQIEDVSGTVVYKMPITAAGLAPINFPRPLRSAAVNTALIITLSAGGGAVLGYINVLGYHRDGSADTGIQP